MHFTLFNIYISFCFFMKTKFLIRLLKNDKFFKQFGNIKAIKMCI